MKYDFLIETDETERIKVVTVWSQFKDADLPVRPRQADPRGRSVHEQMLHQCVSEDLWFRNMLGVDVVAPPLPQQETRLEFMKRYAEDSEKRLAALRKKPEFWWEEDTQFFDVRHSRRAPSQRSIKLRGCRRSAHTVRSRRNGGIGRNTSVRDAWR